MNYLFHFLSAILYLFHTLPEAKYVFHFLRKKMMSTNLDPKLGLVLIWGLGGRRAKRDFTNSGRLMMPSKARQTCFQRRLNIYLRQVLQTIIYFMKIQSQKILHPSWRLNDAPLNT